MAENADFENNDTDLCFKIGDNHIVDAKSYIDACMCADPRKLVSDYKIVVNLQAAVKMFICLGRPLEMHHRPPPGVDPSVVRRSRLRDQHHE